MHLIFPDIGVIGLHFFVADSMGLSVPKFVQWAPNEASVLHQGAFWPFKVVQGHWSLEGRWFWYQL